MTDLVKIAEQTAGRLLFEDPDYQTNFPDDSYEVSYNNLKEGVLKAMRTALSQADGYVRVPREPTEEMNNAGSRVGDYPWDGKKPSRIYRAMIAAAPSQPQEGMSNE